MAEQAASAALVAEASLLEGCLELSAGVEGADGNGSKDAMEPERARLLREIGARFDALNRVLFSAAAAAPRVPARGARGEKLQQAADVRADELAWKSAEEVAGRVAALRRASSDMQAPEGDAGWAESGALQLSEERLRALARRVDAEMETVPAAAGRNVQATGPARTGSGSTLSPTSRDSSPRRSASPPPASAAEAGRPALCSNGSNGDAPSDVPLHVLHGLQGARAAADAAGVAPLRNLLRGSPPEERVSEMALMAPRTDGSPRAGSFAQAGPPLAPHPPAPAHAPNEGSRPPAAAARPTTAPSAGRRARAAQAARAHGIGIGEMVRRGATTQRGQKPGGGWEPRGGGGAAEGADGNVSKGAGVLALLRGSPVPHGKAAEHSAAAPSHVRRRPLSASSAPRVPGHQLALVLPHAAPPRAPSANGSAAPPRAPSANGSAAPPRAPSANGSAAPPRAPSANGSAPGPDRAGRAAERAGDGAPRAWGPARSCACSHPQSRRRGHCAFQGRDRGHCAFQGRGSGGRARRRVPPGPAISRASCPPPPPPRGGRRPTNAPSLRGLAARVLVWPPPPARHRSACLFRCRASDVAARALQAPHPAAPSERRGAPPRRASRAAFRANVRRTALAASHPQHWKGFVEMFVAYRCTTSFRARQALLPESECHVSGKWNGSHGFVFA
jgi:hypothetical protein